MYWRLEPLCSIAERPSRDNAAGAPAQSFPQIPHVGAKMARLGSKNKRLYNSP